MERRMEGIAPYSRDVPGPLNRLIGTCRAFERSEREVKLDQSAGAAPDGSGESAGARPHFERRPSVLGAVPLEEAFSKFPEELPLGSPLVAFPFAFDPVVVPFQKPTAG